MWQHRAARPAAAPGRSRTSPGHSPDSPVPLARPWGARDEPSRTLTRLRKLRNARKSMSTVADLIRRLLPEGSRADRRAWAPCPTWPPDVFAIAASVVNLSGCYAKFRIGDGRRREYLRDISQRAEEWQRTRRPPAAVQQDWTRLINARIELSDNDAGRREYWTPAMQLLATADSAAEGLGFGVESPSPSYFAQIANVAWQAPSALGSRLSKRERQAIATARGVLPFLPESICSRVPPSEACVQPKSRTAQVGCTLRSLSHHLALLPPLGEVMTQWRPLRATGDDHLNLLLVPFPYTLRADAFRAVRTSGFSGNYFTICQYWLAASGFVRDISKFIETLIQQARRDGGAIHGVVMPELSLDKKSAEALARRLAARRYGVELLVTGIFDEERRQNCAFTSILVPAPGTARGKIESWTQPKHHRWRLDRAQIEGYGMSHVLDAGKLWWEETQLGQREVHFRVFRPGASLAVLVCEDLARVDPAQGVLRAVGANLVIALLLDGPQLKDRWSTRAAMALADDPGSSVLTLTSLGTLRRAEECRARRTRAAAVEHHAIALWKEPMAEPVELSLPDDSQALLVSLAFDEEENLTLDGRSDDKNTVRVSLADWRPVRHPDPPPWATATG